MLIEPVSLELFHPALSPASSPLRRAAALMLHCAGRMLAGLAQRLAHAPETSAARTMSPALEFHAEAGAPEGALYLDGRLVAYLPGVQRL